MTVILTTMFFTHRFMAMVSIEFGGLDELADVADNYHCNINKLYGNFNEFTLAIEKVMWNIIVSMYAHYMDLWPINGTCVGHCALLMQSMLEFAFIYGCYCRHECQLKHFNPAVDDPRLSVKSLMKSDEEEIWRADMFRMFKTGMDIMGDADSALYVEPTSMVQVYDLMHARAHDIGLLPPRSRKNKEQTKDVYKQERMEVLHKILSYKDCRKVDCGIIVPTCLRTLTLVLPPSKCMRRYHNPHLQGLFAHKYPENGFGFVQPRGDIRDSIVPPDFQRLPELATEALQTLAREESTPGPSPSMSTDTEATADVHRLCMQSRMPDPDILCQTVLDIMDEVSHSHLLSPETEEYTSDEGSKVDDIDTSPLSPSRRIIIDTAQRMQPEPQGLTAAELLNPCRATGTTPQHSTAALPLKQSPTPCGLAQPLSGRQMDASHNQRAQAMRTLSPAPVDPNKRAKTPNREHMETVRRSRSKHRCHGGSARSQSQPRQNEVLIPAEYESTYRQECQKEEKQCRVDTVKWHLEKREPEKQEVLSHSCRYVSRCTREIKDTLRPMDEIVRGFKVFGDNAMIYMAPATSADLPRQCVHLGHQDVPAELHDYMAMDG